MKLRPASNNTAVRFFNGNDGQGDAEATGSGPMLVQIEAGDAVTFSVIAGTTLKLLGVNEFGEEQWGVAFVDAVGLREPQGHIESEPI